MFQAAELTLDASDRILILAPHPDDETIATGGVIQKAVAMGLPTRLVYLTYGDNAETAFIRYQRRPVVRGKSAQQMGLVRHGEGIAAAGVLGLEPDQVTFLGYPDFRTLVIWAQHWGDCEPCSSMFTQTTVVPYDNALRPGTPYRADEILADIEGILRDFKPTKVFVSHPADHNPDHLSLYLFTRVALWNLSGEIQPELFPFLVHHPEWPEPAGLNPGLPLEPPGRLESGAAWCVSGLTPAEVEKKTAALQKHQTQVKMSEAYLQSFMRSNELFGDYPEATLQFGSLVASRHGASASEGPSTRTIPAELTNAERAKWVGVERRSVWLEHGSFVFAVEFSRPLGPNVGASVSMFGYRHDRPFTGMPKLNVTLRALTYDVRDGSRNLARSAVDVVRAPKGFLIRAPMDLLGKPDRILGNARTYAGKVPLDWIAWRVMNVPPGA
jgi:LmbE family N-acetylglucosaminyl deacetylase